MSTKTIQQAVYVRQCDLCGISCDSTMSQTCWTTQTDSFLKNAGINIDLCKKCTDEFEKFLAHLLRCERIYHMANPKLRLPEELTMTAVGAEVIRARMKFPKNEHLLAALMEEVGELAKSCLEGMDRDEIVKEAIQVACVAIRIVEEGDPEFSTSLPHSNGKCAKCGMNFYRSDGNPICHGCEGGLDVHPDAQVGSAPESRPECPLCGGVTAHEPLCLGNDR